MLQRCYNPKHKAFKNYGGRGITVCPEWRGEGGFAAFLRDMGEKPAGLTLERKNNSLGYEPSNCEWATRTKQNRNTRRNRMLTVNGKTMSLAEWAEANGLQRNTIGRRLRDGWTAEAAVTTPAAPRVGGIKARHK